MKVALFVPYLPAPPTTGGRIRIYQLIKRLAKDLEFHLFATAARRELTPSTQAYLNIFASRNIFPPGLALIPWDSTPLRVRRATPNRLVTAFMREHQRGMFDLIWAEHSHAAAVAHRYRLPWLLNEHNVESAYLQAKFAANGPLTPSAQRQVRATQQWEERMWRSATEVVSVTEADAAHIAKVRGHPPTIVPNGVDLRACEFVSPAERRSKNVLFVGLMNHPPNEQSAVALANEVMPLLWKQHPDARLILCGANPSRTVQQLANARVEVTGTVPSVYPYLRQARVFANLLYHGGGSSLKVLEALAWGLPLVSTTVGARGFGLKDHHHFLEANTPELMAQHIDTLFGDEQLAEQLATAGHHMAQSHSWDALAQQLSVVINSMMTRGS